MNTMEHPVPLFATVSRKTGEAVIHWGDDKDAQEAFGRILTKIGRDARRDAEGENRAEAI